MIQPFIVFPIAQILLGRLPVEKLCSLIAFIHPPLGSVKLLDHTGLSCLLFVLEYRSPLLAGLVILQDSVTVERLFLRFRNEISSAAVTPRNKRMTCHELQK